MEHAVLELLVLRVLEDHSSSCMDDEEERRHLARVLVEVLAAVGFDELSGSSP